MDFDELFRLYHVEIYRYLRYMVGNDEDARDLLQDTFLKAWMNLRRLRNTASFRSWLYRIATNQALNHIRNNKPTDPLPPEESEYGDGQPRAKEPFEWVLLRLALERVDPKYRQCLILQEIIGLSQKEIAEIVEISPSSVSQYVRRGYEELKRNY